MIPDQEGPGTPSAADKFDDENYPAYTMGRAADMLGTTQGFLRSLDEAGLLTPQRSAGGHPARPPPPKVFRPPPGGAAFPPPRRPAGGPRRYPRHQLRLAGRVRELVDQGTPVDAACRIITLEDQLHEAQRLNRSPRLDP